MLRLLAVVVDGDAEHAAGIRRLAMDRRHPVLEQDLDAGFDRRGLERPHQAGAGPDFVVARIGRSAGMDHRPVFDRNLHGAQRRDADLMADLVRRPVDNLDAVRQQKFECRHAVIGEGADDLAIVVAIGRKAVGLDHRPVGQIVEEQVGRIRDAVFLLVAGAAAERQVAARGDGVAADMRLRLDDDDRGAGFTRDDRGRHSGRARADDDNVGLAIPLRVNLPHSRLSDLCSSPCRPPTRGRLYSIADFVSWGGLSEYAIEELPWRISLPPTGSPTRRA